jgi:branched-chain amino acid transport system permease protein
MITSRVRHAFITALIAGILALPLAGARTLDGINGLTIEWHIKEVAIVCGLIFVGRLLLDFIADGHGKIIAPITFIIGMIALITPFSSQFIKSMTVVGALFIAMKAVPAFFDRKDLQPHAVNALVKDGVTRLSKNLNTISYIFIALALIFPFTPLASRYALDVAIMVMTYIMLAWGLNISVGYAGLLDLGYAGFYALGAYSFALLAPAFGLSFWLALPLAGVIAAAAALLLGLPVLRLRGDYFAVVTLGFGEIVRLVVTNWTTLTNGPNGISGIPRPTLFGLEFARQASEGHHTFHEFFGLEFDPMQRVIFLYFIILALALMIGWGSARLRRLPLGRAWEAYRENEIACAAIGINRTWIKLAAYSMGAAVAGMAGAFFATRQGFISPESFTFTESATMLAIVILGGVGHPLGIALAAIFIIGLPEAFRELEQYRMLAFGAGMVLIMISRPGGLMATREPTVRLENTTM